MRVHNVDSLSAFIDRLIVERIKYSSFEDSARQSAGEAGSETFIESEEMKHQIRTIDSIKEKLNDLFTEVYENRSYDYIGEQRTTKGTLVDMIEELIVNNLDNRGSERYRIKTLENGQLDKDALLDALKTDLWLRLAVESRAHNKNSIDSNLKELVENK